ncbi:beta-ketoacyl-[acyl-carrier-protein] synthase family protein [Geomonas anaerohicana]|uniref:Beta-ketoacyl-[acyl-carrier-protein] synthase family protein n=1 Tax=Geomonas anaerohicana TaxID=2798583 RepID=A0ABS0Y8U8_9BACT|nr:beta-ketoacyl-[acyl-carrier-protein] synthase family protein [Geomonas anaerohicana]MBJ6748737.1 beta-ketoacyl-[acyl-carrier-protein] synthase family protein [Geomonas anaerohicana]
MLLRRVVITGVGTVSPFGRGIDNLMDGLLAGRSGVVELPALAEITGMRTRVAALVTGVDPMEIPRKFRRSMSSMSVFATLAAQDAVAMAGLAPEQLSGGQLGVSIGSTTGSPQTMEEFFREFNADHSLERMKSTLFFHIMNHSCASNVAQVLGVTGRVLAPAAACSTSTHAIGYGAEMIGLGKQEFMLCGGADEFHPLTSGTFDIINAASAGFNDTPHQTPRPFDARRDGIVCGEGSGILLLESLDSALARGAEILAEVTGFATNSDPGSIANPDTACIAQCMRLALADAGIEPGEVDYVNAHATATEQGDIAECAAIAEVFGAQTPVSSLKGHLGHTMAASGALELAACVEMLRRGVLVPTLNLDQVDSACAGVLHQREVARRRVDTVIKNNFALGGVNSSIILRRYV